MLMHKKIDRSVWMTALTLGTLYLGIFGSPAAPAHAAASTAQFWLQTMDSCRQAIGGATFVLTGNGLMLTAGPAPGTKPRTVGPSQGCPLQRGNCLTFPGLTGCVSWNIPIPASATQTYEITETAAPKGYVPCTGGSVCSGGPVVVTLTISSGGAFSATVMNVYPDRSVKVWPTVGLPYTGHPNDPAVVHNFQLGTGSCDGDGDADDRLTGSPSSHCDDDHDRWKEEGESE
jgi:hypothetical protein